MILYTRSPASVFVDSILRPFFCPLGAPFFWVAPFIEGAFLRRDVRVLFRDSGGVFVNCGF